MSKLVRLHARMTKDQLIRHLHSDHSEAVKKPIESRRWTREAIDDLHRLIHLGVGR